jgi:hypothetical protein
LAVFKEICKNTYALIFEKKKIIYIFLKNRYFENFDKKKGATKPTTPPIWSNPPTYTE